MFDILLRFLSSRCEVNRTSLCSLISLIITVSSPVRSKCEISHYFMLYFNNPIWRLSLDQLTASLSWWFQDHNFKLWKNSATKHLTSSIKGIVLTPGIVNWTFIDRTQSNSIWLSSIKCDWVWLKYSAIGSDWAFQANNRLRAITCSNWGAVVSLAT